MSPLLRPRALHPLLQLFPGEMSEPGARGWGPPLLPTSDSVSGPLSSRALPRRVSRPEARAGRGRWADCARPRRPGQAGALWLWSRSDDGTFGVDWKCLSHLHFSRRSESGTPKPSDFPGLCQPRSARLASQDCAQRPGGTRVMCREI